MDADDMGSGIINGARLGLMPDAVPGAGPIADPGAAPLTSGQPAPGNNAPVMVPGNAGLEAQKNAAILAAAKGLQMAGQGGYGAAAPAQATATGADPYDVAMLSAAGVKPDDAAPNLPTTTRVQAMLEGTPLIEIDGQRIPSDEGAGAAPSTPVGGTTATPATPQQQAQALKTAQNAAMANPAFQPTGEPGHRVTHCSEGTYAVARAMGADTSPLASPGGTFYDASKQANNLAHAAATPDSGWQQIDLSQAQAKANEGKLVVMAWANPVAGGHGHTVTVRPDDKNTQAATNPTVANVGPLNTTIPYRYAFGPDKRPQVKVYVYAPPSQ